MERQEREDRKRIRILVTAGTLVVIAALILCIFLSRLSVRNVDITEGISVLGNLEQKDTAQTEAEIVTLRMADENAAKAAAEAEATANAEEDSDDEDDEEDDDE